MISGGESPATDGWAYRNPGIVYKQLVLKLWLVLPRLNSIGRHHLPFKTLETPLFHQNVHTKRFITMAGF